MTDDIVARLYKLTEMLDEIEWQDGLLIASQAADEIERLRQLSGEAGQLRKERDEARRLWCVDIGELYSSSALSLAKERGWDCFQEAKP